MGRWGIYRKRLQERNIELSEADVRWAEIAIFKKACRLVQENPDYPGKMLLCSMRMSPVVNGDVRSWHIEKVAGADIVYTCPPPYLEGLLEKGNHIEFRNQVEEPVPDRRHGKIDEDLLLQTRLCRGWLRSSGIQSPSGLVGHGEGIFWRHPIDGRFCSQARRRVLRVRDPSTLTRDFFRLCFQMGRTDPER